MNSNFGRRVFKHGLVFTTTILACSTMQAKEHDIKGSADEKFVHKAVTGGQMEVQMGRLAQQRGQSQDVKSLGETLIRDHTQANERLQQLASSKNITVSQPHLTSLSTNTSTQSSSTATTGISSADNTSAHASVDAKEAKAHKEMAKLQGQSGQEFDKSLVRMAIKDHKQDIAEFERARTEVQDQDIRAFIDETLPKLRQHLQLAQTAARTVGVDESTIAADRDSSDASATAAGSAAAGTTGTRGSDKPSSPASAGDKDRSSLDGYKGATNADASGIGKNSRADLDANVEDRSVTASADVDKNNKVFQKGDGKVLGLSTDKNDGKFLGIIPDPKKKSDLDTKHDAGIKADVNVDGHEASVGGAASTETGRSSTK